MVAGVIDGYADAKGTPGPPQGSKHSHGETPKANPSLRP